MKRLIKLGILTLLIVISCPKFFLTAKDISIITKAENPLKDFYATSYATHSVANLYAFGLEKLFKELGSDSNGLVRYWEFFLLGFGIDFLRYYAHETGHKRVQDSIGLYSQIGVKVDFPPIIPLFSIYSSNWFDTHLAAWYTNPDTDTEIRLIIGGLHQEKHIASIAYEKMVLSGYIELANSILFSNSESYQTQYSIGVLFTADNDQYDPEAYRQLMASKGVDISLAQIAISSLLSNLLTVSMWQSYYLLIKFVGFNKRKIKLHTFGDIVATPLVQYYLTEHGDFFNITIPLLKPLPIFFELGLGFTKFIFRLGVKPFIPISDSFTFCPFFYYNYMDLTAVSGYDIGMRLMFHLLKGKLTLFNYTSYSKFDILNQVKWEGRDDVHFYTAFGLQYHF